MVQVLPTINSIWEWVITSSLTNSQISSGKEITFLVWSLCLFLLFPAFVHAKTYQRTQLVFGNVTATIEIVGEFTKEQAFDKIQNGFDRLKYFDNVFSTYNPRSELYKLRSAILSTVSQPLKEVILESIKFHKLTDGYFDSTFESKDFTLDDFKIHRNKIIFHKSPVAFNPTGLLKGYFLDELLSLYKKDKKIKNILIALGGDVASFTINNKGVNLGLKNPFSHKEEALMTVLLQNEFLSTAGQYERAGHIINVKKSKNEHKQVSVISEKGIISDALSTAMLYMPLSKIGEVARRFDNVKVFVVEYDGKILIIENKGSKK